jgi:pilus assembly protein CpaE
MIRAILISTSADEALNEELATAIEDTPEIEVARIFKTYPTLDDLLRSIRLHKPDFLLLSLQDPAQAEVLAASIDDLVLGLPMVAFGDHLDVQAMPKLMQLGIREYLTSPFNRAKLVELVDLIQQHLRKHPPLVARLGDLYTFFPAKPGVGNSTIAVSTSCGLADDLGTRTLLLDCDLYAGTVKFLLKLGNSGSLLDAIGHAGNLDEDLWSKLVGHWETLAVLHAGELNPPPSVDLASLHRILDVARAQYEVICADLPSSLDPFSVELMRESRRIFLVTTPEVVPLHFAGERLRALARLGMADRVRLLLNRKSGRKGALPDAEVARLVGLPVTYTFSNDYPGVENSILEGSPVSNSSPLGDSILNLARSLTPHAEPKDASKGRKFLEFFHIARAEEPAEAWHD